MTNAHIGQVITLGILHLIFGHCLIRDICSIFRKTTSRKEEGPQLCIKVLARTQNRLGDWVRIETGE